MTIVHFKPKLELCQLNFQIIVASEEKNHFPGVLHRFNYRTETQSEVGVVTSRANMLCKKYSKAKDDKEPIIKYKLLRKNCEHLATFCKTGISNSKHVYCVTGMK